MKPSVIQIQKPIVIGLKTGATIFILGGIIFLSGLFTRINAQQRHTAQANTIEPAWVTHFGLGLGPAIDHFEDMTTDRYGNTYITGWTTAKPYGTGYLTQKYDANGKLVWQAVFNGSGAGDNRPKAIAVDQNGNVAVSGVAWDSVTAGYHVTTVYYNSQGQQQWFQVIPDSITFGGGPLDSDEVTSIAFDSGGNVYLAGALLANKLTDTSILTITSDLLTAKYSAGGELLWKKLYDGGIQMDDRATDMVLDHSGNVLVTGISETGDLKDNFITIKYNSDGTRLWTKNYGNGDYDRSTSITTDQHDNIYVTGYDSTGTYNSYFEPIKYDVTIEYDKNGNQKWLIHPDIYPYDMALDKGGNILITGAVPFPSGGSEFGTAKYTANGDSLWTQVYNGSVNGDNAGYSLAIDTANNIYVTGHEAGPNSGDNVTTLKYDSSGVMKWSKPRSQYPAGYSGPEAGWPLKIAVNGNDQVLVAGTNYSGTDDQNIMVVSYSADGDTLWGQNYNGDPSSYETAKRMVQDAAGNTYIVGNSSDQNGNNQIIFAAKFDPDGKLIWSKHSNYNGSTGDITAAGLAVDANGNVYICAYPLYAVSGSFLIYKYDAQGNLVWTRTYNDPSGGVDEARDITVDKDNNIIITGQSQGQNSTSSLVTVKYDPDGNILWADDHQILDTSDPGDIISDMSGDIYVGGKAANSSSTDIMIVKYNSSGDTLWTFTHNYTFGYDIISSTNMALSADGNIYASATDGFYTSLIIKISSKGDTLWTKKIGTLFSALSVSKLAVDKNDNLYVSAYPSQHISTGDTLASIIKYSPDGNEIWSKKYPGYEITALTTDAQGNAYVSGNANNTDYLTAEYQSDGARKWLGLNDFPEFPGPLIGISVDANNNVTVAGNVLSGFGNWSVVNVLQFNQLATPIAKDPVSTAPASFRLSQNYPNPFNPTTTIRYSLAQPVKVTLSVFNILGQKVATLVDRYQSAGAYSYIWKADGFASGMYLYRLKAGNVVMTKKMLLLK